ncbi:D-Ala-D-Ala carboxypeptidase family metallohydrolase [Fulvimarina sp. 2208YS6-2-32]|uniref:Murein endopeptidase K n=1 Tax=Fulvimarina uroteuthidis TaxID=3098149 RepID=A0ABU5HY47_9HYPH|nr:D-Ala-D-Ala carboxypeptidase family metallohydrolase [Fulvimarina sp. 2208YS6-2-32]MDY8108060.1 D-Ala-D-Ala carboxypeptidase family metallohydrolase [Fulvimarina sp. 2208YS6-2-32]
MTTDDARRPLSAFTSAADPVSRPIEAGPPSWRMASIAVTALLLSPLLSGCMSGVSDISSFGLSQPPSMAQNDAPVDTSSAPEVDVSSLSDVGTATAEPEISDEVAETIAAAAPDASPDRNGPLVPLSAGRQTVAAYAGGRVGEGGASGSATGAGGQSLFQSLFAQEPARTPVANTDRGKGRRIVLNREGAPSDEDDGSLPGVDPKSLFEIGQRASADEDAIEDAAYEVAALSGGFARLSPNGLRVQREDIRTDCFPSQLVGMIRAIEQRFGQRVVVTSGYRSPEHNRRVRGANRSQHMSCKAADIVIPNVDNFKVAAFARSLPGRGGVGTYCHTKAIHIDVGAKREWNWRCRRRR